VLDSPFRRRGVGKLMAVFSEHQVRKEFSSVVGDSLEGVDFNFSAKGNEVDIRHALIFEESTIGTVGFVKGFTRFVVLSPTHVAIDKNFDRHVFGSVGFGEVSHTLRAMEIGDRELAVDIMRLQVLVQSTKADCDEGVRL